ncbi:DNA primase large subunit Spp2 [Pleosporales sp. CAS-2024a]
MAAPKEGGFKMSLGSLKGKVGLKAAAAPKVIKRPRLALGDDEEDDSSKKQEISGWDAAEGGAVDAGGPKQKEAPRVIPALPNRNWREDARRRRQLAKAPHTKDQNTVITEKMEQPQIQYGLTILKHEDQQQQNGAEEDAAPAQPMEDVKDSLTEEQRLEKKALDALVNGKTTDQELVIPLHKHDDAFLDDVKNAPEAPTLDSYEATPIEGFGAALLRGMGWKDGEAIGKNGAPAKPKEVKRRPALLGIGAKEEAAAGVELGDFRGNKGKGKKMAQSYNPVALRNKVTGELITEEELKAKLEQQSMVQDEPKKERRNHDDDEDDRRRERRKDERRSHRRRDDEYDSERRHDKERDGRREKDDYHDSDRRRDKRKDKYRDDEYDFERRRDKRSDDYDCERRPKDKYRDDYYDSERRREKRRHRSRSPSDKKRDRYRSRSRDSKHRDGSRDRDGRRKRARDYDDDDDDDERDERRRRH